MEYQINVILLASRSEVFPPREVALDRSVKKLCCMNHATEDVVVRAAEKIPNMGELGEESRFNIDIQRSELEKGNSGLCEEKHSQCSYLFALHLYHSSEEPMLPEA
jgi:hypothetical protein